MAPAIAAIILAAGEGQRFGDDRSAPKILAPLLGKPLIRHVAEAASASKARPLIAVLGAAALQAEAALAGIEMRAIRNEDPGAGLSHSLALGLRAVPHGCAGAIILLADMPCISATIIDRLLAAYQEAPMPPRAVIPIRDGRRGNPVVLGREIFAEAMTIRGDEGARALLKGRNDGIVECVIDDAAIEIDVDTRESLAALARQMPPV